MFVCRFILKIDILSSLTEPTLFMKVLSSWAFVGNLLTLDDGQMEQ